MLSLDQVVENRKKNLLTQIELDIKDTKSVNEAIKVILDLISEKFEIEIKATDRLEYENQDLANFKQSYKNILKMYNI